MSDWSQATPVFAALVGLLVVEYVPAESKWLESPSLMRPDSVTTLQRVHGLNP